MEKIQDLKTEFNKETEISENSNRNEDATEKLSNPNGGCGT